ncbi:MAG: hypothetical protein DI551_05815, partial [Micavibrio aeruginosavorus]
AQKKAIEDMGKGMALLKSMTKKKTRELVYACGNQIALQCYLLFLARKEQLPDPEILDIARYWQAPPFPIKAEELMAKGVPQGPQLGKKLKQLEAQWVKSDFTKIPKI